LPRASDTTTVSVSTRKRLLAASIAAAIVGLALLAFLRAGTALVVESPLQHAPAAAVFGGKTPFRAIEAAKLYQQGWMQQVWLTEGIYSGADAAMAQMGIQVTPEYAYNRQVLERLGVPGAAIRVLPGHNNNTADEVRTIARAAAEAHADRIILITSSYHTHRVRTLWRMVNGEAVEPIVRYTPDEAFDAAHWWRDTADAWAVSREWFGLLNAWARFPVKSEHW
jgi:uncharacterized SAM-binding protein YcdF (DUF218 family)